MVYLLAQVWLLIASPTWVTVTIPPHPSLVVTDEILTAGTCDAHDTVTGAGQVMLGGVTSFTVIV
jgi:hypothetical protein